MIYTTKNERKVGIFPFLRKRGKSKAACFDRITPDSFGNVPCHPCHDKALSHGTHYRNKWGLKERPIKRMKEKLKKSPFPGKQGEHRYNKEKKFSIPLFPD